MTHSVLSEKMALPYDSHSLVISQLGDYFKAVYMSKRKKSGFEKTTLEDDFRASMIESGDYIYSEMYYNLNSDSKKPCSYIGDKFQSNCSRAYTAIKELALCNKFNYFVTLTFDKNKVLNRYDRKKLMLAVCGWLNDYAYNRGIPKLSYVLVPEQHQDGAWHIHGYISGIPEKDLHAFVIGDSMSSEIAKKICQGETVYNWLPYSKKFGYCDLSPIQDVIKSSRYISKYITKELAESVQKGEHMYYCSRGLIRKHVILALTDVDPTSCDWDFISSPDNIGIGEGFIRTKYLNGTEELENFLSCVTLFSDGAEYVPQTNKFVAPYEPEFWNDGFERPSPDDVEFWNLNTKNVPYPVWNEGFEFIVNDYT